MRYANAGHDKVPFAEFVEPTRFVGMAIYDALEAVTRATAQGYEKIATRVEVHRTVNEISQLSDYLLRDIGIERPDIEALVQRVVENPNIDYRALRVRHTAS